MADSPIVDGRYFLPPIAPISGGVAKSTVMDGRHGWDIHPSATQRPRSELESPHMHVHSINHGTEREPGWGLLFHSEQTRKKSGCNNAATAALADFSLVGVRQFKKPSRYEALRKLIPLYLRHRRSTEERAVLISSKDFILFLCSVNSHKWLMDLLYPLDVPQKDSFRFWILKCRFSSRRRKPICKRNTLDVQGV